MEHTGMSTVLLDADDLRLVKKIPFSRGHINRLIDKKKFPEPIFLAERKRVWIEEEVDAWIEGLKVNRRGFAPKARRNRARDAA
jgi:prophage regulatory protein